MARQSLFLHAFQAGCTGQGARRFVRHRLLHIGAVVQNWRNNLMQAAVQARQQPACGLGTLFAPCLAKQTRGNNPQGDWSETKMKRLFPLTMLVMVSLSPTPALAAADPLDSARWGEMQKQFFADQRVQFSQQLRVTAPAMAEDPMQVPITIDATALVNGEKKVEEVVVFADFNPIVEVLRFYPQGALPELGFRVKLQQSTPVRAAARTSDGIWHVGGTWVNTVGGGCTAPSANAASKDWQARLNHVIGRQWASGENAGRLRLRIDHPMDTGLVAGTPAFHLEEINVSTRNGQPLMRIVTHEPVAENPVFTIQRNSVSGPVIVSGRDNNGNRFQAEIAP